MTARVVFHVDMNSFYASVEVADDPSLLGKPLAIAGNAKKRKGIVVTASYEARAKGIKPPVPLWEAKKLCRDLIVKEPRFERYREKSKQMFQILMEYSELVQPVSIDEGYMDVTHTTSRNSAIHMAETIQQRLLKELGLPSSIGIAPNKFLAKTASDMKKPMGITVLRKREVSTKLWPMAAVEMHGIGEKTAKKLEHHGIKTIGDIAGEDPEKLSRIFGAGGRRMYERAYGIDNRPVDPEEAKQFKSIGHSRTLEEDAVDTKDVYPALTLMSDSVSERLKKKHVYASGIQLTIRYADWETVQRSARLPAPLDDGSIILSTAIKIWENSWNGKPVRLVGVTGIDLVPKGQANKQLDLFSYQSDKKSWEREELLENLNKKFGEGKVRRGFNQPPLN
ncbi:DNA polymerase IV [Alkalicoccus daliensis]|uniref:DNA polymerase IV n=1 Tax=Alkalicoccus daliensis TaxID=745820 RepID=A0A1H0B2A2_9BACI|nr:DNA polymerase IV [Alkalicoccus daliensis]SDN39770.1 DNA polymerase-4 [Alkalicoccus daliensis]